MPKAYLLSIYQETKDADAVAAYAKLAMPAILAGGGVFLARGMPAAVKESGKMERTVLIEFADLASALAVYDSPAYQTALVALGTNAVVRDMRIIEGV